MLVTTAAPFPAPAAGLVRACLEALLGVRALHQVRRCMEVSAFRNLVGQQNCLPLAEIGTIRLQMPSSDAVEALAMLRSRDRWIACVLRLEADRQLGWRCSEFGLIGFLGS